jgi:CheY-like chemotaxis protein
MKEILLITFANKIYRDKLESRGFKVVEFIQPLDEVSVSGIGKITKGIAIIEVIEDSMEMLDGVLSGLRKKNIRIIAITAKINDNFRKYFFRHGIAEVLESAFADRIADYIDITEKNHNKKYGKILLLDDDQQRINIFNTIIGRFNYTPVLATTLDEVFDNMAGVNTQLLLANLGMKNFDLSQFVRRMFSLEASKKIPVIPYKDSMEGLYIHEMISGLNKIARVVLTADELYSFLVDILFRKELSPGMQLLNETLDYDNLNRYITDPVSKIYNTTGPEIFTMKKIITKENISIIYGRIESLKNLIIQVDGLKWLIKYDTAKK